MFVGTFHKLCSVSNMAASTVTNEDVMDDVKTNVLSRVN